MMSTPDFKLKLPIHIRFSDFDSMGHVNNASFLTYLEEARLRYFDRVILEGRSDFWQDGIILARMEIDFRVPVTTYPNCFVSIRCSRIGNKSFDFSYLVTKEENNSVIIYAEAKSVMVCYDYATRQTMPMRDDWKQKVKLFEGNL